MDGAPVGVVTLATGGTLVVSDGFPGCYFDGFNARRDVSWSGRGLAGELGTRAYGALQRENAFDGDMKVWPPTLDEWEALQS